LPTTNEANPFGQVAQQWADIKKAQLAKSTMDEYANSLNAHVLPVFGNKPIDTITALEIEHFTSTLNGNGKSKRNILTPFKSIMKFAKKHGMIDKNPMDDVESIKVSKSDINPLSLDEITLFLDTVDSFFKELFVFLFLTGARFGEAAGLRWKRVDLVKGVVKIRKTLVRGEYKEPKTEGSIRDIKLLPPVIDALREQRKKTMGKSEFVFINKVGGNIHQHSINSHVFKPTLKKAGIPLTRSLKDTRSSYITNALDSGENMGFIQRQVGHTTTKMIINHYYNHIPAPDDGKSLEKAWNSTSILPEPSDDSIQVSENKR
jgi:integrase